MKYNEIKSLGVKLSALGMGCMRYPTQGGDDKIVEEKAIEMMEKCYEAGINYYDTAYVYHGGKSEEFVAKALKKYPRESYYIATKLPTWDCKTPEDFDRFLNEQLKRLDTDYIDFYLLHDFNKERYDRLIPLGIYEWVRKKQAEGKIKFVGYSFHGSAADFEIIAGNHDWDFAMVQLNYLDWIRSDAKDLYESLAKRNIPCIMMEPVRGGALANISEKANAILKEMRPDDSIASWAVRFGTSLENVQVVLSGMSNMEQIEDNLKTINEENGMSEEEFEGIKRALEVHKADSVPCTECKYCMPCPEGVNIAKAFFEYNHHKNWADMNRLRHETKIVMTKENSLPKKCNACGKCMDICPQKIDIIKELAKAQDYFDAMVK